MASMGKSRGWGRERGGWGVCGWRRGLILDWGTGGPQQLCGFSGVAHETLVSGYQTLNPNFLPFSSASAIHPVP